MKILYFTSDFSAQNIEFAQKHGMTMRNAAIVETAQNLEQCDFVYGDETPESYRQAFPMFTLPENTNNANNEALTQAHQEIERLKNELAHHESHNKVQETILEQQGERINQLEDDKVQLTVRIAELEAQLAEKSKQKKQAN